jgi:Ca2+-binding RTX toxin-like protein
MLRIAPAFLAAFVLVSGALAGGGPPRPTHRVVGTAGPDTLVGSARRDDLIGGAGNDELYGGRGGDWLRGGAGADHLYGGDGADWIVGGTADGLPSPSSHRERLLGGAGNDILGTRARGAVLLGGRGDDHIFALDPKSSCRSEACVQWALGGRGGDQIWTDDGNPDVVDCGTGKDVVYADRHDRLSRCERVLRR